MARPTVGQTTERLYGRLPEFYRDADADLDYPLLRFESLVLDQQSEVEDLVDRLATDLADPLLADNAWLDWLAQAVGVQLSPLLTEPQRRDAVVYASSGWRAGTRLALADAARSELTGTKYVAVFDHSTDVTPIGSATQWDVLIVTRGTETPDVAAVLAAVLAKGAKPAGVRLYARSYSTSWNAVETIYPTWNDWEGAGSWDRIQEAIITLGAGAAGASTSSGGAAALVPTRKAAAGGASTSAGGAAARRILRPAAGGASTSAGGAAATIV